MVLKYQHPTSNPDLADGWGSWAGGRTQAHRGMDYQPGAGAAIAAIASGTVSANVWNGALGNVLVIAHPDGMYSGYCHMRERSSLQPGTQVSRGQAIGYVGNTGSATTGPHLHLTVTFTADGTWNNGNINVTTDPFIFINGRLTGDDPGTTPTPTSKGEQDVQYWKYQANGMVAAVDNVRMEYRFLGTYELMVVSNLVSAGITQVSTFSEPAWTNTLGKFREIKAPLPATSGATSAV